MKKTIGIIGGMGPLATCDLMEKIIRHTDAACDQEHIRICVDSNTNIPDRTDAILHHGESPLPEMAKSAVRLQAMGADMLLIACNTAHYFLPELQGYVDIPILDMLSETAKHLKERGICKAAVLATDGTVQTGIYDKALAGVGICPVYPNAEEQKMIMSLVYDYVKAGKSCIDLAGQIAAMEQRLKQQGVQALVLGCTELPIVFDQLGASIPVVDPTEVLACVAVRFAGGKLKDSL